MQEDPGPGRPGFSLIAHSSCYAPRRRPVEQNQFCESLCLRLWVDRISVLQPMACARWAPRASWTRLPRPQGGRMLMDGFMDVSGPDNDG
jgi:hypothetical protein